MQDAVTDLLDSRSRWKEAAIILYSGCHHVPIKEYSMAVGRCLLSGATHVW